MTKKQSTEVATIDEGKLAALADQAAQQEAPDSAAIRVVGGQLTYQDVAVPNNELHVIIIASVYENAYYPGAYDPDNISPPACFAQSISDKDLRPHENSPEQQNGECHGCPQNQWGSGTGRGKACKNIRKLALLPVDGMQNPAESALATLKIPVTSVKEYSKYVNSLAATAKRPPQAVITTISTKPDPKTQFKILFTMKDVVPLEYVEALLARGADVVEPLLLRPYEYEEERADDGKGKKY